MREIVGILMVSDGHHVGDCRRDGLDLPVELVPDFPVRLKVFFWERRTHKIHVVSEVSHMEDHVQVSKLSLSLQLPQGADILVAHVSVQLQSLLNVSS